MLVERFVGVWPDETCERAEGTASLTNTYWKILRLGETSISAVGEGRREPNLILRQGEPRFTATVGCNQLTGDFSLSGDALAFGPAAATTDGLPAPLDDWEARLGELIERTAGYRIDGQHAGAARRGRRLARAVPGGLSLLTALAPGRRCA